MNGPLTRRRNQTARSLLRMLGAACLCSLLVANVLALIAAPAWAATARSWDDDGNSTNKNWSNAANWDPDGIPGIDSNINDTVWIGDHTDAWNDDVQVDLDNVNIWNLTLLDRADLYTNNHELIVNNHTVLSGGTGFVPTRLFVEDNGAEDSFDTGTMDIVYGASVAMRGGILEVDSGRLFIDSDSALSGRGRVDLEYNDGGSGTIVLDSGTVAAEGGNLLVQIAGSGNGLITLGTNSAIAAAGGDLTFHGDLWQYFKIDGARADIQNGHTLTVEAPTPWDMQSGTMVFTGGGTLAGMQMITRTDTCDIDVASGRATFDASLYMQRGTLDVASGAGLRVNEHAHFFSDTTLTFHGGGSTFLVYADTEINQPVFNWDAASSTLIAGATLTINSAEISSAANDGYDAWMNVSGGTLAVHTTGEWAMEGTMNLNSGNVEGSNIVVAGPDDDDAYVFAVTGTSTITPPVRFDDGAHLSIFDGATLNLASTTRFEAGSDIVVDGALHLNGGTFYSGGAVTGSGAIQQNGNAVVDAPTTVSVTTIDLDGLGSSQWTLNHDLILNVESIDSPGDGFDGTIEIPVSTSSLTVNLAQPTDRWSIDSAGTVNFAGSGSIPVIIAGSDVEVAGTINVTNNGAITARTILSGAININTSGRFFRFTGGDLANPNVLAGGAINGPGKLYLPSGRALVGAGTLNADIDFDGSAELLADSGVLEVNGSIEDVGAIGTNSGAGILDVTNPWNTSVADRLELNGGEVTGATITNDGTTTGFGVISTTQFHNNDTLSAAGGTLTVDTVSSPDLDGTGDGVVSAASGDIVVVGPIFTTFTGNVTVGAGHTITFQEGWTLGGDGVLQLNGGISYAQPAQVAGGIMSVAADVMVDRECRFSAPAWFWPTARVSIPDLNDVLWLFEDAAVAAGATFSGAGTLGVAQGATLTLDDEAHLGVHLTNLGRLEIGFSNGRSTVEDYAQFSHGTLAVEIDGTIPAEQYDQLIVTGAAEFSGTGPDFGGTLEVALNENGRSYADPISEGDLDQFDFVVSTTLSGTFGEIVYDGLSLAPSFVGPDFFRSYQGEGLFRIVEYDDSGVAFINYRALPGDANGDLSVDASDFNIWNAHKFSAGTDWTTGDFNGDGNTDASDFNIWNARKFTTARPVGEQVPEPVGWMLLVFAALGAVLGRRQG